MKKKSKSAITRLPIDKDNDSQVSEEINQFIDKGLKTPNESKNSDNKEEIARVQLRLPKSKVEQIDRVLEKRGVKISRHLWLLEAIEEKLRIESGE